MSPGPLRRLVGLLGLVALAPTALMLVTDQITPVDGAVRGSATLLAAVVVGRTAGWWVAAIARGLESPEDAGGQSSPDTPLRRRDDFVTAATAGE